MSSKIRRRLRRAMQAAQATVVPGKRVVIATPMTDTVQAAYCSSLIQLFAFSLLNAPPGTSVGFQQFGGSILPRNRQLLAEKALEVDATHVLWIDSDMEFPPDMLLRLLRHDVDIVATNCISRRPPYMLTARYESGEQVYTSEHSSGLEKVARVGFGVVLHTTDVLRAIADNEPGTPWFDFEWMPEQREYRGEDFVFCRKAKAAGFEINIDHDVSKDVKHVGTFAYSPLFKSQAAGETAK